MANILLVDDEPNILKLSSLIVKSLGYTVHTAENGKLALEYTQAHPEIDLVISDLIMPEMGGFELCQALKGKLRVIIVSAMANEFQLDKIFQTGVLDVIAKPFDINYLRQRMGALMHAIGKNPGYTPETIGTLAGKPLYTGENVLCLHKKSTDIVFEGTRLLCNDPNSFTLDDIIRDSETVGQTVQSRSGGLRIIENIPLENHLETIGILNKTNMVLGDATGVFFSDTSSPELVALFDRVLE